eukprot:CAMPEP_0116997278 /NCGR_PEP_ID=MMETSP0472-20121206/769_1 /TAXON_ID=693140 ORGANISM="Tiarina fusus, Strain LIS" /NCGR_SAMPLE_ID=MMETSP0472 /ASSEMBLY_ACC=CAM_ASM_000603 /LENGTH=400 /DNA_ID=CAMNT_0004696109 /DNA_START=145 /DNA_END=1347 /DNA_ORIENTATION=-
MAPIKPRNETPVGNHIAQTEKEKPRPRSNPFNKSKWERLKIKKTAPEPRHIHGKPKRYRRSIRLRLRARVAIFFCSLGIFLLERYVGFLFQLDDFLDAYYSQMGIDPWQVETSPWKVVAPAQSIHNLTISHQPCPVGLRRMINIHNPKHHNGRNIPKIVHQTSKTRCLTSNFERASRDWAFPRWSYYLHDDEAVERLLHLDFPEFPQLKLVVDKCILSLAAKIYLWQYIVLWMFGGLYVDLNLYPSRFNAATILEADDGLFFTEGESATLSTRFMAVSPRHPLIYYAIEQALAYVLRSRDVGSLDAYQVFGEPNLYRAFSEFTKTIDGKNETAQAMPQGTIKGYGGRSIRVIGRLDGPEQYVSPVFIGAGKSKDYAKMGHRRKRDIEPPTDSCFQRIWTA